MPPYIYPYPYLYPFGTYGPFPIRDPLYSYLDAAYWSAQPTLTSAMVGTEAWRRRAREVPVVVKKAATPASSPLQMGTMVLLGALGVGLLLGLLVGKK